MELTTSMMRIMTSSTTPPKYAMTPPYSDPTIIWMAEQAMATMSDTRAPTQMRLNRSRPSASAPNQNCASGSALM